MHRLGLAGNALGTDGAVHLILAAELGRELETKFTESGAGGLSSAYLGIIILLYNYTISYLQFYYVFMFMHNTYFILSHSNMRCETMAQ